ncbi:MAG: hypothetical protein WC323_00665 [Patescibacteria group bacterium]|jgi:hypothetical protein
MFKFLKKQQTTSESRTEEKEKNKERGELDHIEIRGMPKKFRKESSGGASQTKTVGLLIIVGGGIILISASVFLFWYIYNSGDENKNVAQENANISQESAVNEEDKKEEPEEVIEESAESEIFSCGSNKRALLNSIDDDYGIEEVFACLGEQIANNCQKATSTLKTIDAGEVQFEILGERQSKCLVKASYADDFSGSLSIYANTSMQCFYDIDELDNLGYEPDKLAYYVYQQSSLQNLSAESSNCLGTTVDLWQQQARRQENEEDQNFEFKAGIDTDGDGLTDVEENTVFVTDINKMDTDGDGYNDREEILNLYNPAGNGLLADSELVLIYSNTVYNYNVLYPRDWQRAESAGGIFFMSGVDGSIQILTQDNEENKNIGQWHADLIGESEAGQSSEKTKNNMEVIYSADRQTAYLTSAGGGDKVFIITYSPETGSSLEFLTVLRMMVKSFK